MSETEENRHVQRRHKSLAVQDQLVNLLGEEGKVVQNQLIDKVDRLLPELGSGTVNSLVRRSLSRFEREGLAKWERDPLYLKRKLWYLTLEGLGVFYTAHGMYAYANAIVMLRPEALQHLLPFYLAVAKSKNLADRVEARRDSYTNLNIEFFSGDPSPVNTPYAFVDKVVRELAHDPSIRRDVGNDVVIAVSIAAQKFLKPLEDLSNSLREDVEQLSIESDRAQDRTTRRRQR